VSACWIVCALNARLGDKSDPARKRAQYADPFELLPHQVGEIIDGLLAH
jgi:hypothetical protein